MQREPIINGLGALTPELEVSDLSFEIEKNFVGRLLYSSETFVGSGWMPPDNRVKISMIPPRPKKRKMLNSQIITYIQKLFLKFLGLLTSVFVINITVKLTF